MMRATMWLLFVCAVYQSARTVFAEKCSTRVDIGFLLDSSGSITNYYKDEKKFLIAMTESLSISKAGSHVGVITFSNNVDHSIKLKDHYDMKSFSQAVNKIPLMRSITRIDRALKKAKDEMFKVANGARTDTRKLVILLTDGVQSNVPGAEDPTKYANELRKMGVTVIAVGMGKGVKKAELDKITKGNAYTASTFKELLSDKFIKKLTGETCKISKKPPVVQRPKCSTFMDVGFLLDSSGSIRKYYNDEKKFLIALTDSLGISKAGSHAGVITFSQSVAHSIKLKSHYDMKSFSQAVNKIPLMNSITRIDKALRMAKKELFQVSNGGRANTRKLVILLTDGVQTNQRGSENPATVANELRAMGITVMAVGMGSGVKKAELAKITNNHAYYASTFKELVSAAFIKKITGETCKVSKEPAPAVNGNWGDWGSYSTCSKKCGGGIKKRVRSCDNPKPTKGGKPCAGSPTQVTKCNVQPCPVDGRWGPWGAYTACSKKCGGGLKKRTRTCVAPKFGGKPCAGSAVENTACNAQPCPIDGRWGPWGAYTACSKKCGGGLKKRTRTCVAPKFGGKPCTGSAVENTACNAQPCPTEPPLPWNAIEYPAIRINKRNTLLRTIANLARTWTVSFEFNPRVFQGGWTNLIHLTTGASCCGAGARIPGVWFHGSNSKATKNRLHICSYVRGNGNYCWNSGVIIPRGQWTRIVISQQFVGGKYIYTISIGNVKLVSVVNTTPREFANVRVFASDNWSNAAQGSIRNLVIIPDTQAKRPSGRVAYVLNKKNDCWWKCKGGPCAKVCGSGGYCCRKGWKGCPSDMTAVALPNYHTCIKYRPVNLRPPVPNDHVAYVLNKKNDCWWKCKGGPCAKVCGSGGYCCRKGWKGCPSDMNAVALPNYHTCIKYRPGKICPSDMNALALPNYHTCIKYRPADRPSLPKNAISYPAPRANKRNTLLRTIAKLARTWSVSFEFNPRVFQGGWTNLIHLTTGASCCGAGARIPGIWFHGSNSKATKNRLHICSYVRGNGNYCWNSGVIIPRGQWTRIVISQQFVGAKYIYTISIGNVKLVSVVNTTPKEFANVRVFASDNWSNAAQGSIRNLVIIPNTQVNLRPPVPNDRVAYVLNKKNDCWWKCKGGPCAKVCGSGGYCCRKGWKGCPSDMNAVALPNYHTCIKYRPVSLRPPVPKCTTIMDVGFLLDSSGSIRKYYRYEKKFLIAVAKSLGVSTTGSRVGVITFSQKVVHSIKMKDHNNINSFTQAVNKIPLMNSITRIDLALKLAAKEMFQVRNGARTKTKKLLILLTDGVQSNVRGAVNPTLIADQLRRMGVKVMAVGMGSGVKKSELDKITKGHAFTARTFQELVSDKFIRKLTGETCKMG